jgi:glycerophosphoryl diester phosphodiesterase
MNVSPGCAALGARRMNLPPVVGHRGAAAHAPENTLAGFRTAHALGCGWVEFDVRLSRDGGLVVCHDDSLQRTTTSGGRISTLPLDAIRRCDAGVKFGGAFAGERVPTLVEALSVCRELGLGANVEIKAARGHARATAAAVAAQLAALEAELPPLLISSFLNDAVAEAAAAMPQIPRGMLWRKIPRDWAAITAKLGCTAVHAGQIDLREDLARQVVASGHPLLAYTVNDAERARQLFNWGVASVFSDAPDIILAALAQDAGGARRGARL